MPAFPVLLGSLGAALLLAIVASLRPRRFAAAAALVPAALAVLLAVYVFGDDTYRDTGISRWDAYRSPGGALGPMFVVSLALLALCALALAYAGLGGKRRVYRLTAGIGFLAVAFLVVPTVVGFDLN
jgi:hypothetical protein